MSKALELLNDFQKLTEQSIENVKRKILQRNKPWQCGSDSYPTYEPTQALQLRWDTWSQMCDHVGVGKFEDGRPEGCYVKEDGLTEDYVAGKIGLKFPTNGDCIIAQEGDWIVHVDGKIEIHRQATTRYPEQDKDGKVSMVDGEYLQRIAVI